MHEILKTEFRTIERKILLLQNKIEELERLTATQKQEISHLKFSLENEETSTRISSNKNNLSNLASNMTGGSGVNDKLKQEIDDYIKEIDNCIAQMTN